jgi:hypothetical protein
MAATRAAQLTEAYRILMDAGLRAEYDQLLGSNPGADQPPPAAPPEPGPPSRDVAEAPRPSPMPADRPAQFSFERATRDEFVRKATVGRLREAVAAELGAFAESAARGFDFSCAVKAKGLFGLGAAGPRLLARFVGCVDRAAVQETWAMAAKLEGAGETVVFLMGGAVAPARELADAVAGQRRRGGRARVVMIAVDVRDWHALVPNDAPPWCKGILKQLRAAAAS